MYGGFEVFVYTYLLAGNDRMNRIVCLFFYLEQNVMFLDGVALDKNILIWCLI